MTWWGGANMDSRHKDCRKDAFCFDFPSHKGKDDEEAHCCRIEESSIINIIPTCDISTYSSSYIVNCADKYKLQITN